MSDLSDAFGPGATRADALPEPASGLGHSVTPTIALAGRDNYGKPRQNFADKIAALSDDDFVKEAEQAIWLSAFAGNNPRSDYHWQADACYCDAERRGNPELYNRAWQRASQ